MPESKLNNYYSAIFLYPPREWIEEYELSTFEVGLFIECMYAEWSRLLLDKSINGNNKEFVLLNSNYQRVLDLIVNSREDDNKLLELQQTIDKGLDFFEGELQDYLMELINYKNISIN